MRPRLKSYGVISTCTRSPGRMRILCIRILPELWASTLWPFSNSTRNIAFGSGSITVPSRTIASSFGFGSDSLLVYVVSVYVILALRGLAVSLALLLAPTCYRLPVPPHDPPTRLALGQLRNLFGPLTKDGIPFGHNQSVQSCWRLQLGLGRPLGRPEPSGPVG